MILFDLNDSYSLPMSTRMTFIKFARIELTKKTHNKNLALSQVMEYYSLNDILNAFNSTYIDKGYLVTKPDSEEDRILRLLEYGGQNIKASHLISDIQSQFKLVFYRGGKDV